MNNTVLELYITNAEKFNFYLHELNLTEGISQLSEACLTVYSSTAFSRVDLQKLISSFASVKITQKNNSNQFISRFFFRRDQFCPALRCGTADPDNDDL